jgi:hypothetical protein
MAEPVIKLEPGGQAAIINYKLPETISHFGRGFLDLQINRKFLRLDIDSDTARFEDQVLSSSRPSPITPLNMEETALKAAVIKGMKTGFSDERLFPNNTMFNTMIRFVEKQQPPTYTSMKSTEGPVEPMPYFEVVSSEPVSPRLASLDPNEVVSMMQAGKRLNIYRSMYGTLTYNYVKADNREGRTALDDIASGIYNESFELPGRDSQTGGKIKIISPENDSTISGDSPVNIDVRGTADPRIER